MKKLDQNQIEELIKKYFKYMADLNKNIRNIKKRIANDTEELNRLLEIDKEYIDMITSINTGKGLYHDISMLSCEIDSEIRNNMDKYTKEQLENLKVNYQLALEAEKNLRERYEELSKTAPARSKNIKEKKKSISANKKRLKEKQKEYNSNFLRVKSLDKKLAKLPKIQNN